MHAEERLELIAARPRAEPTLRACRRAWVRPQAVRRDGLSVVTCSLPVAPAVPARPGLPALMTGGRAGNALASIRADIAFSGASGACGLTTPEQARVVQA